MNFCYLPYLLSFFGVLGMALNRSHLLSALLCLELMLISLFFLLSSWIKLVSALALLPTVLLLLTFSACEASAGLALLVSISRTHGSDLIRSLTLLKC